MTKKRTTTRSNTRGKVKKGPSLRQLANGDYVLVRGVSPALVDQVQAMVKDPDVPTFIAEDGSELLNPNDPSYQRELAEAASLRDRRSLHAIISFGMTLCDEEGELIDPPDDGWEFRLKKVGVNWKKEIELITGPIEDESEQIQARREAYLLFVAVSGYDMDLIGEIAGAPDDAQQAAEDMFPSQT
jgi:hypothetical protein